VTVLLSEHPEVQRLSAAQAHEPDGVWLRARCRVLERHAAVLEIVLAFMKLGTLFLNSHNKQDRYSTRGCHDHLQINNALYFAFGYQFINDVYAYTSLREINCT